MATLSVEQFIEWYPQFRTAFDTLVPQAITFATKRVSEKVFGDAYHEAVGLLAADWLSTHMHGQSGRAEDGAKKSNFMVQFEELRKERAPKWLVT